MSLSPDVELVPPFDLLCRVETHLRLLVWYQSRSPSTELPTVESLVDELPRIPWPHPLAWVRKEHDETLLDLSRRGYLSDAETLRTEWHWERLHRSREPISLTPVGGDLLHHWIDLLLIQRNGRLAGQALERANARLDVFRDAMPVAGDRLLAIMGMARFLRLGELPQPVRSCLVRLVATFPGLSRQFPDIPLPPGECPSLPARLHRDTDQLVRLVQGESVSEPPLLTSDLATGEARRLGEHSWIGGSPSAAGDFRKRVQEATKKLAERLRLAQQQPLAHSQRLLETWARGNDLVPSGFSLQLGAWLLAGLRLVQGLMVSDDHLEAVRMNAVAEMDTVVPQPAELLALARAIDLLQVEHAWTGWGEISRRAALDLIIRSPISRATRPFLGNLAREQKADWHNLGCAASSRLIRRHVRRDVSPGWLLLVEWRSLSDPDTSGLLTECALDRLRQVRQALAQPRPDHTGFKEAALLVDPRKCKSVHDLLADLHQRSQTCLPESPLARAWRRIERELAFGILWRWEAHSGDLLSALISLNILSSAWQRGVAWPFARRLLPTDHPPTQLVWLVCLVVDRLVDLRFLPNEQVPWLPEEHKRLEKGTLDLADRCLAQVLTIPAARRELEKRRLMERDHISAHYARRYLDRWPVPARPFHPN